MAVTQNTPLTTHCWPTTTATVVTGQAAYVVAPFRGRIIEAGSVLGSATTTADSTVTVSIAGTAVTGGNWVITQSGSAAGDKDYAATNDSSANTVITGANNFQKGDLIKFAVTGTGTGGGPLSCYLHVVKTG